MRKKSRIVILAFEGVDKTGKSTLIKEINKHTNYYFLCIDRFTGSAWVYDRIFERRDRGRQLKKAEKELSLLSDVLVINILLKCKDEELKNRIEGENRISENQLEQFKKDTDLYEKYKRDITYFPIIEIDTTNKSIKQTVGEILQKVNQIRYEQNNCR